MKKEYTDYLTGLYNREGMYRLWNDIADRYSHVQMIFTDIDNFKSVNDTYGHKAGDRTLEAVSRILKDVFCDGELIIRLAGDEFVVIRPDMCDRDEVVSKADRLLEIMAEERESNRYFEMISFSMGIVWNAEVASGIDTILSYSDSAMYFAKESGKNCYVFFDDYEEQIKRDTEMDATAREALENGSFEIVYYPIIHLQNSEILRNAAGVVWKRNNGDDWKRSDFERVLTKNGYIKFVDLYAFEQMCRGYRMYSDRDVSGKTICINMSLILLEENIVDTLKKILDTYQVPIGRIEIIVDESMFGKRNTERVIKSLIKLHDAGFGLGLGGFGGDFASFRYIKTIPFSMIIFDENYLRSNYNDATGTDVLGTLFNLAEGLHFLSVGYGINNRKEAEFLIENGCTGAAGDYFCRPLPLERYVEYVEGSKVERTEYTYKFEKNLSTTKGTHTGEIIGGGVGYCEGISDCWGGLFFDGGPVNTNMVRLPGELIKKGSFTITLWLRPYEVQNWISAVYIRHQKGFTSFMPTVSGNLCMFRMRPDGDIPWTDNMYDGLVIGKWTHVALVYDSFSNTDRLFIDGRFTKMRNDIQNMGKASMFCLGGDCYQVSYRGEMSSLKIFDVPLTDDEIYRLYMSYKEEPGFKGDDKPKERIYYEAHDPAIYEDAASGMFYIYATHGNVMRSADMEKWESVPDALKAVPAEAREWTDSEDIWAPDIVRVGDEYRLYCSNSRWGVQQSCIFLAVSDSASGPFEPSGIVLKTDDTLDVNGIDANIIADHETGEQYMVYGSFWGGIHILPLDKESGLARDRGADGTGVGSLRLMKDYKEGMTIYDLPEKDRELRRGKCLAVRSAWTSGSIEGAYIIYIEETGYYYLFVSYGSLKNDYNIRVGRSRNIMGPFLDYNGRDLADPDDAEMTRGLMIACGYRWLTGMSYMGPGHNSVLRRENGEMFLVSHIRKLRFLGEDCGEGLLQIRRLFITPDGWLILSPQDYSKETFRIARDPVIPGIYERIELRPSIPQGISHAHPLKLYEDGRLECCSIQGTWTRADDFTLIFSYGPIREYVHIEKGLDKDINKTTVLLSGLTDQGICTWAKKNLEFSL